MSYLDNYSKVYDTLGLPSSVRANPSQVVTHEAFYREGDKNYKAELVLKWGDDCKNGLNHFSVTLNVKVKNPASSTYQEYYHGRDKPLLEKHFPQYAHLLKYHLFSKNGPFYYFENTLFLAGTRDFLGNLPGEQKKTYSGLNCWVSDDGRIHHGEKAPSSDWQPVISQGKARELESARYCASWPDATDEELSLPESELFEKLKNRLPGLVLEFKREIEDLGFIY